MQKKAEPIEMPFGLRIRVGPRNHVCNRGRDNFKGRKGRTVVKYSDSLP